MIFEGGRLLYWPDAADICEGQKSLSHEKNYVITLIITYLLNLEKTFLLSVYAEANHLAKYHNSLFFSQMLARIVAKSTGDPLFPIVSISVTHIEQACTCTSVQQLEQV